MLKHTSTASGPATTANGQLRIGSNTTTPSTPTSPATPAATVAAVAAANATANVLATTARAIHLRPQQPLNISTLNASTLQTSTATPTLNGGSRIPSGAPNVAASSTPIATLLNIAAPMPAAAIGSNMHTYTNQPMLITTGNNNSNNNNINPNNNNNNNNNNATTATTHNNNNNNTILTPNHNHINHNNNTNTNNNNNHNNTNNYSNCNNLTGMLINQSKHGPGPREALTSLGLLCLVSLLFALLSLIFLLKISPNSREDSLRNANTEDFIIVYDVTLALCALSLSLNLCCLLVCAIQFLFAVKLVRSPMFDGRDNKYLEKSSASRTCAVGGFFISIPIFLTGIILYTFNHFHSTPAIITSVLIGIGIVFCGGAMVHNVFIWQKEKTISYRSPPMNMSLISSAAHAHNMQHPHHISPMATGLTTTLASLPPPVQFLNSSYHTPMQTHTYSLSLQPQNHSNNHINLHPTSVTPVSPNHSHGSFNPLICNSGGGGGAAQINSSFLMRPSTTTPPTPKPINGACLLGREATGSVSPGIPPTLDMSNITSNSLHELSTLV